MHEMSLAEGMLQLVEDGARRHAATGVTAVWLEIGALSQVEVDALKRLQTETATELDALLPSVLDREFSGKL